jgi:hypothetical protein
VYAFDADDNTDANSNPVWTASLIDTAHGATSGETTGNIVSDIGPVCTDIVPQVGITSTPVIDSTTGTMYVEAKSKKTDGTYVHRLHMLDITTGAEKSPGPTVISATVPGTSDGGSTITFDALHNLNRAALLLNGTVYLGYPSHCDETPYHGWMYAYNASTLAQTAVYITTPNGQQGQGGIWLSGAGISADSSGNIFTAVGNGSFDATDVGDSVLKLALSGNTISLSDYFTPFDQGNDDLNDYDVGSGGVLLLPDQPGAHPHEKVLGTKGGTIYLIDWDQLTTNNQHYCGSGCTSDPEIVQEILNADVPIWLFATPAYWNNTVYFWGSSDVLKAYTLTTGCLAGPAHLRPTRSDSRARRLQFQRMETRTASSGRLIRRRSPAPGHRRLAPPCCTRIMPRTWQTNFGTAPRPRIIVTLRGNLSNSRCQPWPTETFTSARKLNSTCTGCLVRNRSRCRCRPSECRCGHLL